jgi:hypothetical protein
MGRRSKKLKFNISDDTKIGIVIGVLIFILLIIILFVTCNEQFTNTKNTKLFKTNKGYMPNKNLLLQGETPFNKWYGLLLKKNPNITYEEARENWNTKMKSIQNFLTSPKDKLSSVLLERRKLLEENGDAHNLLSKLVQNSIITKS